MLQSLRFSRFQGFGYNGLCNEHLFQRPPPHNYVPHQDTRLFEFFAFIFVFVFFLIFYNKMLLVFISSLIVLKTYVVTLIFKYNFLGKAQHRQVKEEHIPPRLNIQMYNTAHVNVCTCMCREITSILTKTFMD
jgi:hypothetical protein